MYSSIKRKKCKCGCGKYPTLGCGGWNYNCAPDEIKDKFKGRRQLQVKNQNARKNTQCRLRKDIYKNSEDKINLDLWFRCRHYEMTGICANCFGKTMKDDDKKYHYSIAHVLKKSIFKSVATHPFNWIELCFYGNSCHSEFDNLGYEHCKEHNPELWKKIVYRFKIIYPDIAEEERKYVPDVLLNELSKV